jgi:hypothetical protein
MSVILIFAIFVVFGDALAIGLSSIVERFSETASLFVFLALFILVFWIAWICAVRVAERFQARQA